MKYVANYLNWHINTAWFESKIFLIEGFSFHRCNGLHHTHYDSPVKFAIFDNPLFFTPYQRVVKLKCS